MGNGEVDRHRVACLLNTLFVSLYILTHFIMILIHQIQLLTTQISTISKILIEVKA